MSTCTPFAAEPLGPSVLVAAVVPGPEAETPQIPRRSGWRRAIHGLGAGIEWLFGLLSMILGLSLLATVPLLQFLSLGYLLESSGRVARNGRLRDGFVGMHKAARVGSVVLDSWLLLWPTRLASELWYSSLVINGHDRTTGRWRLGLVVLAVLTVGHIVWAVLRGGRLRDFVWPAPVKLWRRLRSGGIYRDARDGFWNFMRSLRLPYYFQLGLRGGAGAILWLALPVTLLVLASRIPVPLGVVSGLAGALTLGTVLLYLPFLQTRFAAHNHWGALFAWRPVRQAFQRAPVACWFALFSTLALAIPLYLLKAELVPREAAWLPSLVFVVFIWPARLLTGWAMGRADHRSDPRHRVFRWLSRFALLPVVFIYVLVVYFTQYVSWYGGLSLYEQHAFLLPVPFLGY